MTRVAGSRVPKPEETPLPQSSGGDTSDEGTGPCLSGIEQREAQGNQSTEDNGIPKEEEEISTFTSSTEDFIYSRYSDTLGSRPGTQNRTPQLPEGNSKEGFWTSVMGCLNHKRAVPRGIPSTNSSRESSPSVPPTPPRAPEDRRKSSRHKPTHSHQRKNRVYTRKQHNDLRDQLRQAEQERDNEVEKQSGLKRDLENAQGDLGRAQQKLSEANTKIQNLERDVRDLWGNSTYWREGCEHWEGAHGRLKVKFDEQGGQIQIVQSQLRKATAQDRIRASEVEELRRELQKQTSVIEEFQGHAVSALARHVSRDLTDDQIQQELAAMFSGRARSWCADLALQGPIPDHDLIRKELIKLGILVEERADELDLSLDIMPVVILQAILVDSLCQFLKDPFFLAAVFPNYNSTELYKALDTTQKKIYQLNASGVLEWRIATINMLEKSRPFTPDDEVLTHMVDSFLAIGKPLLIGELEGADRDDLFSLFFDFGRLALQMWRLKVDIKVQSGGGPWTPHPKRTTWSDGRDLGISHPTGNAPGESIFLMQPLIASTLEHGADLGSGPVWSKAVLWFHETTNPC